MIGTPDGYSPCFFVTAIAAPARLLSNEEADLMIFVVGGMEATGAQHAAIVQRAIPAMKGM
jgi:hypothetical protein